MEVNTPALVLFFFVTDSCCYSCYGFFVSAVTVTNGVLLRYVTVLQLLQWIFNTYRKYFKFFFERENILIFFERENILKISVREIKFYCNTVTHIYFGISNRINTRFSCYSYNCNSAVTTVTAKLFESVYSVESISLLK